MYIFDSHISRSLLQDLLRFYGRLGKESWTLGKGQDKQNRVHWVIKNLEKASWGCFFGSVVWGAKTTIGYREY